MKIKIQKVSGHRYKGTLDMGEGTLYNTTLEHHRPGCAVRELVNLLVAKYGEPQTVELELEWD